MQAAAQSVHGRSVNDLLKFWLRLAFDQDGAGRAAFAFFTEVALRVTFALTSPTTEMMITTK